MSPPSIRRTMIEPPDAVKVVLGFAQVKIAVVGVILAVGVGLTVTVAFAEATQLLAFVTITE